ncbi:hypothetical protein C0Z18_22445 [Trinickia dabaoshanensis]|uniref:Uncharacterized protein n=1 Tax=Trinickia dabaoshanensis TaxID=564714 RepID=A0A2N7VIC1_9BURK|nr:hypothetical protein [Trinickia dabaoshanensis]PMS16899.1 hypothetical protein C0Z18_22445 [Trinickia dabaoshanensis]
MRRVKLWLTFACLYLGFVHIAFAGPLDDYMRASQQFDEWTQATGSMPRLTDERGAALLKTLSDTHRFLDDVTFDDAQLPLLMDVCGKANRNVMSYVLFGLRDHVDKSMPIATVQQAVLTLVQRNQVTYQDELSELQPFEVRCLARQTPLMARFMDKLKPEELTSIRRKGIEQTRQGLDNVVLGTLRLATDESLSMRYRSSMLKALADSASELIPMLTLDERAKLRTAANGTLDSAPDGLKIYITSIAQNLTLPTCDGLCRY